jgi:hypothetical protein
MRFLSLRALFLLGFVVAMPVLALPPVARWFDELLYGPPPTNFGIPPAASRPIQEVVQPATAERDSPAGFDAQGLAASAHASQRPSDAVAPPPLLMPQAPFAPPANQEKIEQPSKIDEQTIVHLQQVRQRLEELGAEYVIVETIDGSGKYRFHCRMLVDAQTRFTRAFEATSTDPIAAADQVLREVEGWRVAALEKGTRQQ